MACAVLPGTEKQYQQLRTLLAKQTFVGIVAGPPGTGKKTLVRYVAAETPLQTHDVEVEHVWPPEELRARIARLGTQLTDSSSAGRAPQNTLWVVHNAEILERCAAVWKTVESYGLRVVLLMHDVPSAYREQLVPIQFNRVTDARMAEWLRREYPGADAVRVAQAAKGDLNQARIAATWHAGDKDISGHVWFDTLALVNGGRVEPEKVSTGWVHENMLERCTDIEAAARLSETFALADTMRSLEGAGVTSNAPNIEADIVQRAVHQAHAAGKTKWVKGVRAPPRVDRPDGFARREWRRRRALSSAENIHRSKRRAADGVDETQAKAPKTQIHASAAGAAEKSSPSAVVVSEPGGRPAGGAAFSSNGTRAVVNSHAHAAVDAVGSCSSDASRPGTAARAQALRADAGHEEPSGRMVYDGKPEFEIRAAELTQHTGERRTFCPGPALEHFAKSRVVIFGKCSGMDDFHAIAETIGVLGCIVAEFDMGTYALIFKERNREFKTCPECYALCDARVSARGR